MFLDSAGPIDRFEWGMFTILGVRHGEGGRGVGKDIRLVGTHVTEWAERRGHLLTPEMITGVFGLGLEVLCIGNGVDEALVCPDTVKMGIVEMGISDVRVIATPDACRAYNQLYREGRRVALLAHGTC